MASRRISLSLIGGLVLATACSGVTPEGDVGETRATGSPSPSTLVVDAEPDASAYAVGSAPSLPDPNAWVPRDPATLAERLTRTTRSLRDAIDEWRASGGAGDWPPPRPVVLLALDEQRIYQVLARMGDRRRAATLRRLPPGVRPAARDATFAAMRLADGFGGVVTEEPPELRTRPPLPADKLRGFYERASRRFDVPWTLLAAVHFMETKFGRVVSPSWAGAQGPMQFLPSTWEAFGMGGDIHDTRDAILGAANYLSATGSPADDRAALWAYNPVDYYGDAVLAYDRLMRRDVRAYYALYNWQVFVRGPSGLVQLTGPGADA
jgi:hypothetical protein